MLVFWERHKRGLTQARGSSHRTCTSDTDTCTTYRKRDGQNPANQLNDKLIQASIYCETTCKVMVRVCTVESGGKRSFIPGSMLDTSRASAEVREQVSFTGWDTTINQENWHTVQQASYKDPKRTVF